MRATIAFLNIDDELLRQETYNPPSENPLSALDDIRIWLGTCSIPEGCTKLCIEMDRENGHQL